MADDDGPATADINVNTVTGKLKAAWTGRPSHTGLVFYDFDNRWSLTHSEVQSLSMKCAHYLHTHGVRKGDVVCNMIYNSMEREVTNFGILLAGAVVMHGDAINDRGRAFWQPLAQAKAKFLILEPDPLTCGWKMLKDDIGGTDADVERCTRSSQNAPDLQKVFKFQVEHRIPTAVRHKYKSCFEILRAHVGTLDERLSSHDNAVIMLDKDPVEHHYKLILRTHGEVIKMSQRMMDLMDCKADDVVYCDYPLSWLPGLHYHYVCLGCTTVQSTLTDCPPTKVVTDTWDLVVAEKCTMAALTPPMIQMMSSHCEDIPEPCHKLRALTCTGLVRQSVMDAIGPCTQNIIICYSRIETGLVSCLVVNAQTAAMYSEGCVGDMAQQVRTRLDSNLTQHTDTLPTKASQIGEILLEGDLVCTSYYNDPELTKSSYTSDGYLLTGDIGFTNEKRHLYILGRKSDAIIRDNTPIFPREVEEKVNQCPGIWKVKVVSIIGERGSIQMCACVIPRHNDAVTIGKVKEFCRYQLGGVSDDDKNPHMPAYIFFFDSFPMQGGKVNKRTLAYLASEIVEGNTRLSM